MNTFKWKARKEGQGLSWRERREARKIARKCWIESGGDRAKAEQLLRADGATVEMDIATLLAILQIAIKLWMWWNSNNVSEPSETPSATEPISYEGDEGDHDDQ